MTSTSTPRITVLGSLNIDLTSFVSRHPLPGETLTGNGFGIFPGGKGANQATACAKLATRRPAPPRARVTMIGAVGSPRRDPYGRMLLDALSSAGVDAAGVRVREDAQTGVAVIVVDEPTGENRIILSPGANYTLRPEHFSQASSLAASAATPAAAAASTATSATAAIIPAPDPDFLPDLLVLQLEIPLPTVVAAIHTAHTAGVPVLLNAAPAPATPERAGVLTASYPYITHLMVNENEAAALSGIPLAELDEPAGVEKAAEWFVARGVRNVVITLGARGASWMTTDGKGLEPAAAVKAVVDTTAAGDTFVGSYSLAVADGAAAQRMGGEGGAFDIAAAVREAVFASARTVERKGALESVPWGDELARAHDAVDG